ncbi:ankyrin repeat domain-containing protein [Clostridium brassicae]|uniref:Ankyrin repeat domain-containing protein n=1 Tax=Clostridium brassicae TaxID=2999072 RepID=A0ABT4D9X4_9CLOT|nr:ankyrin repeat domain-containing protein [Clostridium brassicae]MCY6958026.1 ankyrin repeat domain-containing protein [Clostridium brassicae]
MEKNRTMKKKIIIFIIPIFIIITCFYYLRNKITETHNKGEYKITSINIYKNTPAWELALAVKNEKTSTIEKIAKDKPELLNYQDPKYGVTLLLWSVGMEKYESAEVLLKCGSNPDIARKNGETPLFLAAGYSWIDNDAKKDPKYVKLLLRYGANPNKNYVGKDSGIMESGTSPLMNSISGGFEKTKALVEAGADINYKTKRGDTVAREALLRDGTPEYAYYLIVQKKAKVTDPYYKLQIFEDEDPNEKLFLVNILRNWVFPLDSKEYKMKMEIVDEFARQGVNYKDAKINKHTLGQIKKLYPNDWEDYIKKY